MADKLHITPALIRQYLEGKLDDRTMHALEKQALDDPFLAEALEGYSHHDADQQPALADLQSRLEKRVQEPPKKRGMYVRWLAAASVLIMVVAGSLMLLNRPQISPSIVVQESVLQKDTGPAAQGGLSQEELKASEKQDSIATEQKQLTLQDGKEIPLKKKEAPAAMKMRAPAPAPPASEMADVSPAKPAAALSRNDIQLKAPDTRSSRIFGKKEHAYDSAGMFSMSKSNKVNPGDTIFIGRRQQQDTDLMAKSRQEGYIAGQPAKYYDPRKDNDYNLISGVVIDAKTGARIPGVSVTEKGSDRAVVTDTSGNYALRVSKKENVELNFASAGYQRKKVNVSPLSTGKVDVSLPAANEIRIRGIASNVEAEKRANPNPEPVMGEKVYQIYLQSKKYLIAKATPITGEVRLSFTVMPDSTLTDFKVLNSLGKIADDAAIRIVQDGPKWIPAANKQKAVVELKVPIVIKP